MDKLEFKNCILNVFHVKFINNIFKLQDNIYIIYYYGKAIIKTNTPINNKIKSFNHNFTYIYNNKEDFIKDLIWIRKNILNDTIEIDINDILNNVNNAYDIYEQNIRNNFQKTLNEFDELTNPFFNNKIYNFSFCDLIKYDDINFKCNYIDKNHFDCELLNKDETFLISYSRNFESYRARLSKNIDKNTYIYLEHIVDLGIKDELVFLVNFDHMNKMSLKYDILNDCIINSKKTINDVSPIYIEVINEDIENINDFIKKHNTLVKKR